MFRGSNAAHQTSTPFPEHSLEVSLPRWISPYPASFSGPAAVFWQRQGFDQDARLPPRTSRAHLRGAIFSFRSGPRCFGTTLVRILTQDAGLEAQKDYKC